jgi:gliding motility-associated-like protein
MQINMKTLRYILPGLLLLLGGLQPLWATHNRAGEIHIEQIGPLTIRATIITWTKASSVNADRDTLTICWGDSSCEPVGRINGNGQGVVLPNDIKYNLYVAEHTYAGPSTYVIAMTDPNRIAGIVNVNPPSSDNVPFHIQTTYSFQDPQFGGNNTTPFLLQPPIDNACVGKPFKHNPNAFDPDEGDSLSYRLIVPLQALRTPVPNYSYPNQIGAGAGNILQINEKTGDILWLSPQVPGEYNLAFIIVTWREGAPIDTTIRDMQIFVDVCDNNPPVVQAPEEICVVAGETIGFEVSGNDPDGDRILLTALGGPFVTPFSPAEFTAPNTHQAPPVSGIFRWNTACEHISKQPYSVVFKAVDSVGFSVPLLADLKTLSVKVVGPPPEDVQVAAVQNSVRVSWELPYTCEDAADDYFYGFSVWRRLGSNPFPIDTCTPGLEGKGYTELVFVTREIQNGRYVFVDNNVESGQTYCYRVLAKFAKISAGGYAFNLVESLPSEEICAQLPRNLPLITNVDVQSTSATGGQMQVRWSKPLAQDLDTLLNPGPYRYRLLRARGFSGPALAPVPGADFTVAQFWQANDTIFNDINLNTAGEPYRYRVEFYVRGEDTPLGAANMASSIFLTVTATDNTNLLSWREEVPWSNASYTIYRFNSGSGQFDSIGISSTPAYADRGLENGKEYCYRVRSTGTYSIGGIRDPLINFSQETCGAPLDTTPPCPPNLTVSNLCSEGQTPAAGPPYENRLQWTNPNLTCGGLPDAVGYRLWYAAGEADPLEELADINRADQTGFVHQLNDGLAGCYAVSALDSAGNESALSNRVCVDNCPLYELPNVFTPNGDGANDLYTPFPGRRFVEEVDFQVFNRWGNLIFSTSDPQLNWNGRSNSGKEMAEGTYFYTCQVFERRVNGIVRNPTVLSGYIELVRGGD